MRKLVTARAALRRPQRADLPSPLFALVLADAPPAALGGLAEEPAVERDREHRAAGRKGRVGGKHGRDVRAAKAGGPEVQKQGELSVLEAEQHLTPFIVFLLYMSTEQKAFLWNPLN